MYARKIKLSLITLMIFSFGPKVFSDNSSHGKPLDFSNDSGSSVGVILLIVLILLAVIGGLRERFKN